MNGGIVKLQLDQFLLIYVLLIITTIVMKKCRVNQTKQLVAASIKMTVQLIIAGLILTYIFGNPHPVFTLAYLAAMTAFSIHRAVSKNRDLNRRFKLAIGLSIALSGMLVLIFFICAVVREDIFNPQYVIPISGMIMGNTMTGVSLGVKSFRETLLDQRAKRDAAHLHRSVAEGHTSALCAAVAGNRPASDDQFHGRNGHSVPARYDDRTDTCGHNASYGHTLSDLDDDSHLHVSNRGLLQLIYLGYKTLYDPKEQIINI